MKRILMIEISPRGQDSASRAVSDTLAARLVSLFSKLAILIKGAEGAGFAPLDGFPYTHFPGARR